MADHFERRIDGTEYIVDVVADDGHYDSGTMRIEPPLAMNDEYVRVLHESYGFKILDSLSTKRATMISYIMDLEGEVSNDTAREYLNDTINLLVRDVVAAENRASFIENGRWNH